VICQRADHRVLPCGSSDCREFWPLRQAARRCAVQPL